MVEYKLWLRIIGLCFRIVLNFIWNLIFVFGNLVGFFFVIVLPILLIVEQLFMTG